MILPISEKLSAHFLLSPRRITLISFSCFSNVRREEEGAEFQDGRKSSSWFFHFSAVLSQFVKTPFGLFSSVWPWFNRIWWIDKKVSFLFNTKLEDSRRETFSRPIQLSKKWNASYFWDFLELFYVFCLVVQCSVHHHAHHFVIGISGILCLAVMYRRLLYMSVFCVYPAHVVLGCRKYVKKRNWRPFFPFPCCTRGYYCWYYCHQMFPDSQYIC